MFWYALWYMVLYGISVVSYGVRMLWCAMVWYGFVLCYVVRYGLLWNCVVWCDVYVVWYSMVICYALL